MPDGGVLAPCAVPPRATVALRLPYAGPLVMRMLTVYVLLLFIVSGNVLDLIGYDYSAIDGSPVTKIHVATYFLIVTFAVFVASYPHKADLARYYLATKLGTLFFIAAATFALVNIVAGGRNGFGMVFDTDLHLFLCCMLLPFVPPDGMDRLERFLHGFFAVNAVLAAAELVMGGNVFPLTTYSPDGMVTLEPRATAFLSHPLHAASVTAAYIVSLLLGAGRLLRPGLRIPMIALQVLALLAFGGRTALLLILVIVGLALVWRSVQVLAGGAVSRRGLAVAAALVPLAVALVATLAAAGFFDAFIDRFSEDGGSARSRVLMLPLLMSFDWTDFLWGAPTDYVRAQIYAFGLEWGVENPFIQMGVYQGVVVATFITVGLGLVFLELSRRLEPRALVAIGVYLLLCATFGSLAGRFINLTIFTVVVATLFRRQGAPAHVVA